MSYLEVSLLHTFTSSSVLSWVIRFTMRFKGNITSSVRSKWRELKKRLILIRMKGNTNDCHRESTLKYPVAGLGIVYPPYLHRQRTPNSRFHAGPYYWFAFLQGLYGILCLGCRVSHAEVGYHCQSYSKDLFHLQGDSNTNKVNDIDKGSANPKTSLDTRSIA